MRTFLKTLYKSCLSLVLIGLIILIGTNIAVVLTTKNDIYDINELNEINADCILVLGAGVIDNVRPSHMLEDRLISGIDLYENNAGNKLLMSGDNGQLYYDEVNVMKNYAIDNGIPSSDIFMDHAGFSTYESIYRAKEIFDVEKVVIVTQKYHLYRAMYIAKQFDLEVYGVASNPREYSYQYQREFREILARSKDFFISVFKPEPTFLGEKIPISGNGDVTNDK